MPNRSGTVRGSKIVPKVSPSAEQVTQASGSSVSSTSQCTCRSMWISLDVDDRGDREHDRRREQALNRAEDDLLERHQRHRQRRQHAVLDLLRVAELLHHRQRHRLDPLEHDREADDARHQDRRERRLAGRPRPAPTPVPMVGKT